MNNVEFLRQLSKPRKITLNDWAMAYYDAQVLPYDGTAFDTIVAAINESVRRVNDGEESYSGRINEFGNFMEDVFCSAFSELSGTETKNLGTGYPDANANIDESNFYFEFKTRGDFDKSDSFRSFFTSAPSDRTKARKNLKDGFHLLIAFETNGPGALTGRTYLKDLNGYEYTVENIQQGSNKTMDEQLTNLLEVYL